jgi:hypothetical protein
MPTIKQQRAQYVKSLGIASIILSSIFLPIEGYMIYQFWITPRATTIFLHFNFQYRAGKTDVENNIIEEPYFKMLQMFEQHPTWNFSVELQAAMIERMMENETRFGAILNLTHKLNHRGQMEIICGFYSSQIVHAYPQEVVEWDFKHAFNILQEANLTRSRVMLCQEGQVMLGFANVFNTSYAEGIDTLLVSWQQLHTFSPPGHSFPDSPIYLVENVVPNKKMYLLNYDYLPKIEATFMHSWIFATDAEIAVEKDDAEVEFDVDPIRLKDFENQWLMLEREGNNFFTLEDWTNHCIRAGAVKTLNFYIPEVHWTPIRYNSSFTWMGRNNANSDDGEMIANNRRGYYTVKATRILYQYYKDHISLENRTKIENLIDNAERLVLLAMVSDTTGINPAYYERKYGESNVFYAISNCSESISIISSEISWLNQDNTYQVDLKHHTVNNNSADFIFPINTKMLSLNDLPFEIDARTSSDKSKYEPIKIVREKEFEGLKYKSLEVKFPGTWNWTIDKPNLIQITLFLDASFIHYCPSLTDSISLTRNMSRSEYGSHPIYVWLPLCNGLIFIPNEKISDIGLAIINDCAIRHTTLLWEENFIRYLEVEGIHMNASYHLLILEDINLTDAVNFAQRINDQRLWIVSDDITKMEGYPAYLIYNQVSNATEGEIVKG